MSSNLSVTASCNVARWGDVPVGFVACLPQPGTSKPPRWDPDGAPRTMRRESRLVVLPQYQGLGIGARISNCLAQRVMRQGYRYFSLTAHPRFGASRNNSSLWHETVRAPAARRRRRRRRRRAELLLWRRFGTRRRRCTSLCTRRKIARRAKRRRRRCYGVFIRKRPSKFKIRNTS